MKIPWGDLLFTAVAGALIRKYVTDRPDLPPVAVREVFAKQPMAVYIERIVWALTDDFDVARIRAVRNFVNQHEPILADGYRTETPPEEMARRVDALMRAPDVSGSLSEEMRLRALFGSPPPVASEPPVASDPVADRTESRET